MMSINPRPLSRPGTPLVTVEEVDEWREELRNLLEQRAILDRKLAALQNRLNAAQFFIQERAASNIASSVSASEQKSPQSGIAGSLLSEPPSPANMQDAVLYILSKNPDGLTPKQISNNIGIWPNLSPKIKRAHPNYIYTVLMRLATLEKIEKDGAVYKLAEMKMAAS